MSRSICMTIRQLAGSSAITVTTEWIVDGVVTAKRRTRVRNPEARNLEFDMACQIQGYAQSKVKIALDQLQLPFASE